MAVEMPPVPADTTLHGSNLLPFSERLIARLGPPAWRGRLLWTLVPLLQVAVLTSLIPREAIEVPGQQQFAGVLPSALVWSYAIFHALWASRRVAVQAQALQPRLEALAGRSESTFRGIGSARGPLAITVLLTLLFAADTWRAVGPQLALAKVPLDIAMHLPVVNWAWTYLMVMLGLRRLGGERLRLDAYTGDRTLGLRGIGSLAATAFGNFGLNLAPVVLLNFGYGLGLYTGLAFFLAGAAAFYLSLLGLHRQMSAVRHDQLQRAGALYSQAYAPLRGSPTLEALREQAPLLGAAEALERRAEAIHTWPFTNALLARLVTVGSAVLTSLVVKVVSGALGV